MVGRCFIFAVFKEEAIALAKALRSSAESFLMSVKLMWNSRASVASKGFPLVTDSRVLKSLVL